MLLSNGTRLGPYEITGPIGSGGMGEVYKARDTRLDRIVAIKVSNEQFSGRFEGEARAIAALNHPHVCQLYDVGPNYLVMEYIEGQPLKGPLPLDQALLYGTQICNALDAAHRRGITHRDLKPGNILVTGSGVKVLDFGLAKMAPAVTASENALTQALTAEGQMVGTLHYMAPEQLSGLEADARSDIFSFGLVLYEMLTGKRAFEGSSPATVMAAILEREAPSLAGVAPVALDRVLRRCLEKDPENRWQTCRDLKAALEWIALGDFEGPRTIQRRTLFPWIASAAGIGVAGGAGLAAWAWRGRSSPAVARAIRFRLAPNEGARHKVAISRQGMALSPVGGRVAMIAISDRHQMIWVHRLDSLTATALQGTEGADVVFWSPDGQYIGFWAGGKLKTIPAEGGTARPICDLPVVWSATWNQDGVIVAEAARGVSSQISVKSGTISPGRRLRWPKFLPDGKHLLYVNVDPKIGGHRAYAADLSTGPETALMPTDTCVTFAPDQAAGGVGSGQGFILFGRGGTLLAQRFDANRLRVTGDPFPVAKEVPYFVGRAWSEFDTSADGILVYSTGFQKSQLTWLDRSGREVGKVGDPQGFFQAFRISPDGRNLAADIADFGTGGTDIWVYDLAHSTAERLTSDPGTEAWPLWSPDGTHIAFARGAQGEPPQIRVKTLSGRGSEEAFQPGPFQIPTDWSSDGRWIFYETTGGDGSEEIWLASLADRKVMPLLHGNSRFPTLSPNQDYLAFAATETGRSQIYVQHFDGGDSPKLSGERLRVSRDGGAIPRWRRDGREIFFLSTDPERHLMAVAVRRGKGGEIELGTPTALFRVPASTLGPGSAGYEPGPDGQRFLVPVEKVDSTRLQVVVNWQTGLHQGG